MRGEGRRARGVGRTDVCSRGGRVWLAPPGRRVGRAKRPRHRRGRAEPVRGRQKCRAAKLCSVSLSGDARPVYGALSRRVPLLDAEAVSLGANVLKASARPVAGVRTRAYMPHAVLCHAETVSLGANVLKASVRPVAGVSTRAQMPHAVLRRHRGGRAFSGALRNVAHPCAGVGHRVDAHVALRRHRGGLAFRMH